MTFRRTIEVEQLIWSRFLVVEAIHQTPLVNRILARSVRRQLAQRIIVVFVRGTSPRLAGGAPNIAVVGVRFLVVAVPAGKHATTAMEIPSRAAIRTTIVMAADMDSGAHIECLKGYVPVFGRSSIRTAARRCMSGRLV